MDLQTEKPEKDCGKILKELEVLGRRVEELHKIITDLEAILKPIMLPQPPTSVLGTEAKESAMSDIATAIKQKRTSIENVNVKLSELQRRIEL